MMDDGHRFANRSCGIHPNRTGPLRARRPGLTATPDQTTRQPPDLSIAARLTTPAGFDHALTAIRRLDVVPLERSDLAMRNELSVSL